MIYIYTKDEGDYMQKLKNWKEKNFSKVKFYDQTLWKNYLADIGVISSGVTLLSFFLTAKDFDFKIELSISIGVILLIGVFLVKWWLANHLKSVQLRINNTKITIQEGNIFELLEKKPEERKGEISVIAVNDCYDTIVDNRIIAEKSLHGQYINRLIKDKKLDALNNTIETDEILNKPNKRVELQGREKGKRVQYPIGSVIEFESYVLAAFTKFDKNNKAYVSAEEYVRFWMCFWENIDEIYAGRTINIPLIGAGITRFRNGKPTKQELLEVMLWSLKISGFHNTYGDRKINILIYTADVYDIDFYHIQHNCNFR